MAKTPTSDTPSFYIHNIDHSHLHTSLSYTSFHQRETIARKRVRRGPLSEEPITLYDTSYEGPAKTRRVNPQNLASRLGPDLVRDMEAFIFPGAKMPTFSVRKELQERYAVDRRHIYDYFHSRGLRVAKEDKHTNLVKGRTVKAQSRSCSKSSPDLSDETRIHGFHDSDRMRRNRTLVVKGPVIYSDSVQSREPEHKLDINQPRLGFPENYELLDKSRPSSLNTDDETPKSHAFSPKEALEYERSASRPVDSYFRDGYLCERMMELEELQINSLQTPSNAARSCFSDPLLPVVDDHHLLSQEERTEFYNQVSNSIGPALGIQESAGTYKAYMEERSRLYFDRLFSDSRKTAYTSCKATHSGGSTSPVHNMQHQLRAPPGEDSAAAITRDDVNFQAWLLATVSYTDHPEGEDSQSGRSYGMHASKEFSALPIVAKQTSIPSESGTSGFSPADDLFPEPSDYTVLNSDPVNATLDIIAGTNEKEMEIDEVELLLKPLFSSRSVKPNTSASTFRRISHISKPVILPSPTLLLDSLNNQQRPPPISVGKHANVQQTAAADTWMDTPEFNDLSMAYSPSTQRRIRKQSFNARPVRSRTYSAGGGI